MSLDKLVQKALEVAAIKTVSESPISNNTNRSSKPVDLNEEFICKAAHAIRESAKTDYPNLSASFKAYVNYNSIPVDMRDLIYLAVFSGR